MKTNMIIISKIQEEPFDCPCCGSCFPTGMNITFNDTIIWKQYSDGHMHSEETELSILDSILNFWKQLQDNNLNEQFTEEKRFAWAKNTREAIFLVLPKLG